jgi:hypothetical protein
LTTEQKSAGKIKAFVRETPAVHLPANIIGSDSLKKLMKLGFHLNDEA